MRLVDGAEAILEDLPKSSTHRVDVPLEAGDEQGTGVARYGSLQLVRERTLAVLAELAGSVITIGGDCGVSLASIEHANVRANESLAVIWFDAHPDLNNPESSPSGAFTGMVLRSLIGDGAPGLVPDVPLSPGRIVLAGMRATDPGEDEYIAAAGIKSLGIEKLGSPKALLAALKATGAASVYLHIDLDVLDPAEIAGLSYPLPFGLETATLIALIRAVKTKFPIAGATIAQFSPASPEEAVDDLPTILRIIGAITA
jgi:arginase